MLNYAELLPGANFRPYVRKYWTIDNTLSPLIPATKYVLPNTCFTLALISGAGVIIHHSSQVHHLVTGHYMVGQLSQKTGVTLLPGTKAIMVQFNPWAAPLLSNIPFHELTDNFADLINVSRTLALALRGADAFGRLHAIKQLEQVLNHYLAPTSASAFVAGCFHLFNNTGPTQPFKITALAAYTGYTTRGIEKKFKQHVGLTPKQTHTIFKVRSVVDALVLPGHEQTLTALAYRFGYADQSHFIKAFQQVMNEPPSRFVEEQYILPNPQ